MIHLLYILLYFDIFSLVCFLCKLHAFARISDISYELEDRQNKSARNTILEYPAKHIKGIPYVGFPTTNLLGSSREDVSRFTEDICANNEKQNCLTHEYNWNATHTGDSIRQDHIVRNQYSSLPYPPVIKERLYKEKEYYRGSEGNKPYVINHPIVLENLNHFVFKGGNNFM